MRINLISSVNASMRIKLIRIKLMRVNLPSVNAALPVIFCSEIKFP